MAVTKVTVNPSITFTAGLVSLLVRSLLNLSVCLFFQHKLYSNITFPGAGFPFKLYILYLFGPLIFFLIADLRETDYQ